MDTTQLATATTILAEIALALHPILIKQVGVGLPTQLLARIGTYTVLGSALSSSSDKKLAWGDWSTATKSIGYGLMNLIHIGSSYVSYKHLPAGSALALFYTFPFFNILAGVFFLGESFKPIMVPLLAMAFLGVLLISWYTTEGFSDRDGQETQQTKKNIPLGIFAALLSALTETLIFLLAKSDSESSPYLTILKLYPAALVGLLGYVGVTGTSVQTSLKNWIPLILFNVFIGFLGYSLRFWSIPRLPTDVFSILTFIGVAAGYMWGLLYSKEVPSMGALGGAALITGSLGVLRRYL
jgi:drug/metabolite transporter (DMT)-like permease